MLNFTVNVWGVQAPKYYVNTAILKILQSIIVARSCFNIGQLTTDSRIATVGQLTFAPWAWSYSTLHSLGVGNGKWVPATGKIKVDDLYRGSLR